MTMLQTLAVLRDNTPMPLPQVDLGKVPDASAAGPLANYFGVSTPTIMAVATALDGDMQRTAKIVADALAPISKAQADMVTMGVNYLREAGKLASQYLTFVPVTMAATTAQIENLSQQTQKAAVSRSNQLIRELEPLTKQLNDLVHHEATRATRNRHKHTWKRQVTKTRPVMPDKKQSTLHSAN